MQRDQCTTEQAQARINSQWSDEKKLNLADYVINNNYLDPILPQIVNVIAELSLDNQN